MCFTPVAQVNTETGPTRGHIGVKKKTTKKQDHTGQLSKWPIGYTLVFLVHGGFTENSRSKGSLLSDLSVNWTVPHTGLGSVAEVKKGGLKIKKKKNT